MVGSLFAALIPTAQAQSVRGAVVDRASGGPVGRGFVVLVDSAGQDYARTPTSRDGAFAFPNVVPGQYRIRSSRIGYQIEWSGFFQVPSAAAASVVLGVTAIPVRLEAIEVEEAARCDVTPAEGRQSAALWQEIVKALDATSWASGGSQYVFSTMLSQRTLERNRTTVIAQRTQHTTGRSSAPFFSRDIRSLVANGYAAATVEGDIMLYAPDAAALRSEEFVATHCYRVVRTRRDDRQLVGLRFEPSPNRDIPDIEGVLWVDETSAELRFVEFDYVHTDALFRRETAKGRVEFLQLPSGVWVVERWRIEAPLLAEREYNDRGQRVRQLEVEGFYVTRGDIERVVTATGEEVYATDLSQIAGRVVTADSTPLNGAIVRLQGVGRADTTDATGQFVLHGAFDGEYALTVSSARLDSLWDRAPSRASVQIQLGQRVHIGLLPAVPVDSVSASVCRNAQAATDGDWTIVGQINTVSGSPVGGADVLVAWQTLEDIRSGRIGHQWVATTNSNGRYRVCGVPTESMIFLSAEKDGSISAPASLVFEKDSARAWAGPGMAQRSQPVAERVYRHDFTTAASVSAALVGWIVNGETNDVLAGARVSVDSTMEISTNSRGQFILTGLTPGSQEVRVRRIGYVPIIFRIDAGPGTTIVDPAATRLVPATIALDPIVVEATNPFRRRRLAGFEERRRNTSGSFLTRAEWERMGNPIETTDILRRMEGLYIEPGPSFAWRWVVYTSRGKSLGTFRSATVGARGCFPLVFLDGQFIGAADPRQTNGVNVDDLVTPAELEAVEVYSSASQMPAEFNRTGSACGVIVLWTR